MSMRSEDDHWTGDPEVDRAMLVTHAMADAPYVPSPRRQSALGSGGEFIAAMLAVLLVLGLLDLIVILFS